MTPLRSGRAFPTLVALSAWFGLAVQFGATATATGSAAAAAWIMARYFTVWVNLAVALGFTGIALGRRASPALLGGLTLNSLLVAIVYHLLLAGTLVQTGPERLADLFFHSVTPALVLVHWLMRVPRGALRYRDVLPWTAAPVLYLAAALLRGGSDGIYPYPFLDVATSGWVGVARAATGIAAGFVAAGLALVGFDRRLGHAAATARPVRTKPK